MMSLSVSIEDTASPKLSRFGNAENQSRCLDLVLKKVGQQYRAFVRKAYLSGGMLKRQTGGLAKSLRVAKKKGAKNWFWVGPVGTTERIRKSPKGWFINQLQYVSLAIILGHAGGYVVKPRTDRKKEKPKPLVFQGPGGAAVFVRGEIRGKARPFLDDSFHAFSWPTATDRAVDWVYEKELAKAGLK